MASPLRLGVVGTGLIWRGTHRDIIKGMPGDFVVKAICARSEAAQDTSRADFPEARIFEDWREMVAFDGIDAVVVATPIALNAPVTMAALEAGKDAFVEKPFAASSLQGQAVIDTQQRTGRQVYILEQLLYSKGWDRIREIIASGEIGKLVMFDRAMHGFIDTSIDPYGFGKTQWRVKGEFPLGPLFDGGVHEVALHSYLFGRAIKVYATGQSYRPEHGEFDNVNMLATFENNVTALLTHSGYLGGKRSYFHIRGTDGLIVCDYWKITVENKDGKTREEQFADSAGDFFSGLHRTMWKELAANVRDGSPSRYRPQDALKDIAFLESVERSIKTAKEVSIEA